MNVFFINLLIYFIVMLLGLYFKRNKFVFAFQLVFIFFMMSGSRGLADENVYISRFNQIDLFSGYTEYMYAWFVSVCRNLNFDYYGWLSLISLFYTFCLGLVSVKLTKNHNLVLSMMMIFPLIIDTTQLRQTIAMCYGWLGVLCLMKCKNRYSKVLISLLFFGLAVLNHASTILYFCVFPIFFMHKRNTFIFYSMFLYFITFVCVAFPNIFSSIVGLFNESKALQVLSHNYNWKSNLMAIIYCLTILMISMIPIFYNKLIVHSKISKFQIIVFRCNVVLGICMVLIPISADFYRIIQLMLLFNIISISRTLKNYSFIVTKKNVIHISITAILLFICLYNLILDNTNIQTVYFPFFENNVFLFNS